RGCEARSDRERNTHACGAPRAWVARSGILDSARGPLSTGRRDRTGWAPSDAPRKAIPVMATNRAKRLLLCVCGGYQAYTIPGFIMSLLRHFADDVLVVLSRSAARLVARDAVEVASRNPVFVELSDRAEGIYVPHIELTRKTD